MSLNKGQQAFVDVWTRRLLVKWAVKLLAGEDFTIPKTEQLYWDHAVDRGWAKKSATDLTSTGYGVGASHLKK